MSLTLARYESALSRALWQIRTYSSQHLSFGMPEARAGHDVASKPVADDSHIAAQSVQALRQARTAPPEDPKLVSVGQFSRHGELWRTYRRVDEVGVRLLGGAGPGVGV